MSLQIRDFKSWGFFVALNNTFWKSKHKCFRSLLSKEIRSCCNLKAAWVRSFKAVCERSSGVLRSAIPSINERPRREIALGKGGGGGREKRRLLIRVELFP